MAEFTGTDGNDTITPTVVSAGVTSDPPGSLPGGGDDYLAGGTGADELDGGGGDDRLYAERETDPFDPFDVLSDTEANRLRGGNGADRLFGALGADWLHGNVGNDYVEGNAGNDELYGGDGKDELVGGAGNDYLNGGYGNDSLDGGDGRDTYLGRWGNDTFYVDDFDQRLGKYVLRSESVNGGDDRDTLVIDQLSDLDIDLRGGKVTWSESRAKLSLVSIEDVRCGSGGTVRGSDAANRIEGFGDSTFRGLGGNDFLLSIDQSLRAFGGTGSDTLVGGRDRDRLFGDHGADKIHGRNGNDLLCGGGGNDKLYGDTGFGVGGGTGLDQLFGGAGKDILQGNFRSDTLYGGAGRDRFQFTSQFDSKYEDIDHIRGGSPAGAPKAGAVKAAFEAPGKGKGDIIDVSAIDADDSRGGNQPFIFGVERQGGLWLKDIGDVTVVHGNIDQDPTAEFVVYIHDGAGIRAEDYSRADFLL